MESDEQKAAKQLDERFADAKERERHLSDFLVRYLTTVNAGGIAMLTLGGTFGKANFTSFAWLAVPFALGLVCAGLALFIEHHRICANYYAPSLIEPQAVERRYMSTPL
ncbi:MAG: hypothetical protein V3V96_05735 [Acidiferrobacterales bacterium]